MSPTIIDEIARIRSLLPRGADPQLVILKGHLIVEEQLNLLLASRFANPKYIWDAKLEFSQLLSLVKASHFSDLEPWVWGAVGQLNALRNLLAHTLESRKIGEKAGTFVKLVEDNTEKIEGSTEEQLFGAIVKVLVNVLSLRAFT